MRTSHALQLLCLLLVTPCTALTACQERQRRPDLYLIPDGYIGWVRINFNVSDTPALPIENGYYVFKFPSTGKIQTSSALEEGLAEDKYYYYSSSGDITRSLKETISGGGGMIWAGFTGKVQGDDVYYEYFFVGTEKDLKDHGWKFKDIDGNPKVGPIY